MPPLTHFYPSEIGTSIERLKELGYTADHLGKPLESTDQLVEMKHQDVILNNAGAEFVLRVSKFIDTLLVKYYKLDPFYKASAKEDLVGHCVVTLSPHTSTGFVGRIIGYEDVNVGLAHPYLISARRRNCDGDEDTTILMMDALINFSKHYLPTTIGGTMDAPLILAANIKPEEVDDEVWNMETDTEYTKEFYDKTMQHVPPGEVKVGMVESRLKSEAAYSGLEFTHGTSAEALKDAPKRSAYTTLKTMQDKIDMQFSLSDKLYSIDRADAAKRLILSHFIPDLMGNLHSFSKQTFRCVSCNAKYRRVPLIGKCTKCSGKLVLTISKGGIEKYLNTAINLSERYKLEPYIRQRIMLLKQEIETVFGAVGAAGDIPTKQFNLANFM
ncbi:DNA polymerase II, large subunit DP2 [mine drainage metagenome]|uniref:DNA polymerase II, large subunit DP2 n=1 Tax=mine drainage metagenome TaxID=410659 RepID=T1ATP6_9ZZZZ